MYSLILKRDPGRLRLNQGASLKTDKSKGLRMGSRNQGYPLLTWLRPTFDNVPVRYIPVSLEPCEPQSSYVKKGQLRKDKPTQSRPF